jgi:hypothetical protein
VPDDFIESAHSGGGVTVSRYLPDPLS